MQRIFMGIVVAAALSLAVQPLEGASAQPIDPTATSVTVCGFTLSGTGTIDGSTCTGDVTGYPAYRNSLQQLLGTTVGSGQASVLVVSGTGLDLSAAGASLYLVDTYNETVSAVSGIFNSGGTYVAMSIVEPVVTGTCPNCSPPPESREKSSHGGGADTQSQLSTPELPPTGGAAG